MKRLAILSLLGALPLLAQDRPSASDAALEEEKVWMKVAADSIPRTVVIEFNLGGDAFAAAGSGGIVSEDGYVVTCAHVAEAMDIQRPGTKYEYSIVTMDGRRHKAKLVGKNSANDIALMKFDGKELPHFAIEERPAPAAGDRVMALGFPMGNVGLGRLQPAPGKDALLVQPSLSLGRVAEAAVPFFIVGPGVKKYYPDAVESDTPVFMGNSGGPLVDRTGRLVGLNAAIVPASNKTYSLSAASIGRHFADLKAGRNVAGVEPDPSESIQRLGRTLWDALSSNFSLVEPEPARAYLAPPFEKMARARSGGVVRLVRGDAHAGYATLIDGEGHALTSLHVVDRSSYLDRIVKEIERRAGESDFLREVWEGAKRFLEEDQELFAELPGGRKAAVEVKKKSSDAKLALLKIDLPKGSKVAPIPKLLRGPRGPGQWVAALGSDGRVVGVGLLSAGRHTVRGAMRIPGSLREAWDILTKDSKGLEGNDLTDAVMHDVPLRYRDLGAPLLDSGGRLLGVNVYHACRGVSYAIGIREALKAFDFDPGM